jgi:DNA polymerase-1
MRIVLDCEANGLKPTKIWVVVCKDIDTGQYHIFKDFHDDTNIRQLNSFIERSTLILGHNYLGYDGPALRNLFGTPLVVEKIIDTYLLSKLIDYPREKHSVEDYGREFGLEKGDFKDWSKYSQEMEDYCIRDVDITERIYYKYKKYIDNPKHQRSIRTVHAFQNVVSDIEARGFMLDTRKVSSLLEKVTGELATYDKAILEAFPARLKPIREITPKATKYGTISLSSIPVLLRHDITPYTVDCPFTYCSWVDFNPSSHKQIIECLNRAGWKPEAKTKTHIDTERSYNKLSRSRSKDPKVALELNSLYTDLKKLREVGWKVNEQNLATLPASAPAPARILAKRILYEARRRTLTEWNNLVREDGRVHGKFQSIGTWTHRMSHQNPNMANIANEHDLKGNIKLLGKELRQCWIVPKNRLLVGVDAEGIQLRIFAHYLNDPEFTKEIISGDVHTYNQSVLGEVCRTRDAAKRYIYALLLGGGQGKLREILDCSEEAGNASYERLLARYPGFARLKSEVIPADAKRGWFTGLDGRRVRIYGDTESERRHLAMSGYLQNGEAVVMETAVVESYPLILELDSFFVNIVHDEVQMETPNDFKIALRAAEIFADAIKQAGITLEMNCPLAGSFMNKKKDYTIGRNWYQTH